MNYGRLGGLIVEPNSNQITLGKENLLENPQSMTKNFQSKSAHAIGLVVATN